MLRLFTVLMLLLVPLSGCLAGVGTITAQTGLGAATSHVEDLLDSETTPTLMAVGSIEPFAHYFDEDDDFEINTYADADQGDGKIPAWAYVYCVDDDLVVVFLAAGIGVLADVRDGGECTEDDLEFAINDWDVDSDEAADILAEHPDWPEPTPSTLTAWSLFQMPDANGTTPVWAVETDQADGDAYAVALVDARTGEVLEIGDDPSYGGDLFASEGSCSFGSSWGSNSGGVPDLAGETGPQFELGGDGFISFSVSTENQVGDVQVVLEGPDGTLFSDVIATETLGGDRIEQHFDDVVAGTYTLRIITEVAASVAYEYESGYDTCA